MIWKRNWEMVIISCSPLTLDMVEGYLNNYGYSSVIEITILLPTRMIYQIPNELGYSVCIVQGFVLRHLRKPL